jgi:hypothetical protein
VHGRSSRCVLSLRTLHRLGRHKRPGWGEGSLRTLARLARVKPAGPLSLCNGLPPHLLPPMAPREGPRKKKGPRPNFLNPASQVHHCSLSLLSSLSMYNHTTHAAKPACTVLPSESLALACCVNEVRVCQVYVQLFPMVRTEERCLSALRGVYPCCLADSWLLPATLSTTLNLDSPTLHSRESFIQLRSESAG